MVGAPPSPVGSSRLIGEATAARAVVVRLDAARYPRRMEPTPRRPVLGAPAEAALTEFLAWLRGHFGERVREIKLFGSRARLEAHAESDVDVLVAVQDLTSTERREIGQQAGDAMTHHGVLLSPLCMSTAHLASLRARGRGIAQEIDRDGIPL
jgi:hypothetical protein